MNKNAHTERSPNRRQTVYAGNMLNSRDITETEKIVVEKYSNQFQYVLVDEYQDTNQVQASIVKTFAKKHRNLLVVGDDAQSIYSFRGAQIENILKFGK